MSDFITRMKQFWEWCLAGIDKLTESTDFYILPEVYTFIVRLVLPVLSIVILVRCILPLLRFEKKNAVWGYLDLADGTRLPVNHWENSIGRSKSSDIVIDLAFISRNHAVLTFSGGEWFIADLGSKGGVKVNGKQVEKSGVVKYGDVISLAGLDMVLAPPGEGPAASQNGNPETGLDDTTRIYGKLFGSRKLGGGNSAKSVDGGDNDKSMGNSQTHGGGFFKNNISLKNRNGIVNRKAAGISKGGTGVGSYSTGSGNVSAAGGQNPTGIKGSNFKSGTTLLLIFVFQILGAIQICLSEVSDINPSIPMTFLLFILAECVYISAMRLSGAKYFELELLAFFLCGLNLLVVAAAAPAALYKQLVSIAAGITAYTVFGILLQDLGRARKVKYVMSACALVLLALNLLLGERRFGAKNWINLGFITFQPMEFVKVAFVIAGTATLDRLLTKQNMTAFICFSGACICTLALIRDFGTAVVFFCAFIVIAFMRSGDLRTIVLVITGAALGAFMAVSFLPYIASRFATWRHAWEHPNTSGYQQTRTMIAVASGGMFGVGGGNGYLSNISAADTDLVFGMICEEWGLLVGLTVVISFIFFAVYVIAITKNCRSSFYAIAACGAVSMFLVQTGLNVFGSLDILPLTGVTIPFISNGGTSMITSWGLLTFIKSADERMRRSKPVVNYKKRRLVP